MKHRNRIVSLLFFIRLLCFYFLVYFAKASEVHSKAYMINAAIQNRSILEQGGIGHDACAGILGPNWQNVTKQRSSTCPNLVVWVPKKPGFTEFVKVNEEFNVEGGFSIAIFCHALQFLPFSIQPIFIPFVNEKGEFKGTYDDLLLNMKDKVLYLYVFKEGSPYKKLTCGRGWMLYFLENIVTGRFNGNNKNVRNMETDVSQLFDYFDPKDTCEAVAGDVTIRYNRIQDSSFTIPYLSSEVYMLVHGSHKWNQTLLTFLKPFTWRLWITVIGACIFIGVAIAVLEYRVGNPKFAIPFYHKVVMVIWFPISTFFFHEGKILNRCSKVVLVMWLSMIFIVVQIFTATLSSWLTLDQLLPTLPSSFDNVGYQDGSFLKEFIKQDHNCFGNPVPLKTLEEFKNALSNGSVNVVVDELPYIELFLAKYGSDYMKIGPINRESGIAFAFPRGSPLVDDFSRAVINITESKIMMEMIEKYDLGTDDKSQPNQPHPKSLDVQSFIGLFIFMGSVTIAAIIWSEISLMHGNNKIVPLTSTVNSMHL